MYYTYILYSKNSTLFTKEKLSTYQSDYIAITVDMKNLPSSELLGFFYGKKLNHLNPKQNN